MPERTVYKQYDYTTDDLVAKRKQEFSPAAALSCEHYHDVKNKENLPGLLR